MAYEIRENSGSLFANKRWEQESHPNREGKVNIDGKLYWVKGWDKTTQTGDPWVSLSFKPVEEKVVSQNKTETQDDSSELSDQIPF